MRRIRTIFAALLLVTTGATAREQKVLLSRLSMERDADMLTLSFHLDVNKHLAKDTRLLVLAPVIQDDVNKWSFSPVMIQGSASPDGHEPGRHVIRARAGDDVAYSVAIPFQPWMEGAELVLETLNVGWNGTPVVKRRQLLPPAPAPAGQAGQTGQASTLSTADRLAKRYPYLLPLDDAAGVLSPGDAPASGLNFFFHQASVRVEPEYAGNWEALSDLLATIRAIEYSGNSRIQYILISGSASPEGFFETNRRLAHGRAMAVKDYLLRYSSVQDEAILIHDTPEDWKGLRALVEQSRMPGREQVLCVIDNVPVWDPVRQVGREGELKKLYGGEPYRYMREHFFPQLRQAALVWIYYTNE
jgi:outer membrane protein OmpA-like peptidoglycan-associated protein